MTTPDQCFIDLALQVASFSPCRSKRGVALYDPTTGAFRGAGYNGPPAPITCPGRAICTGTCGQRSVHAEVRALREAAGYIANGHPPGPYDLIHVEIAADGGVVACSGPSCPSCAAQILDAGFVGGVWLYQTHESILDLSMAAVASGDVRYELRGQELEDPHRVVRCVPLPAWIRYTADEFYPVSLERCRRQP